MAIIELDENGDLWDSDQLAHSVRLIERTSKPLLITFVHGWRHDARPGDQDLTQFHQFIEHINTVKPGGYTACGVYVGWRAAPVNERIGIPFITTLPGVFSFWKVKWSTDRMADIGLSRILNQTSAAAWRKDGRSVAIGHSFGGRILEKTAAILAASQAGGATIRPVTDLVILVNPASESLTARKFKLALSGWDEKYPLIVSIGAQNDGANGKAWKWGYRLSPQPPTRNYTVHGLKDPQKTYLDRTVTNDKKQITHTLEAWSGTLPQTTGNAFARNLSQLSSTSQDNPIWVTTEEGADPRPFRLRKLDLSQVDGVDFVHDSKAYWTLQVPREVLSGHSGNRSKGGVLASSMTDLMAAIFARAQLSRRGDAGPTSPVSISTSH